MTERVTLLAHLALRPLVMDAAMGTRLIEDGLDPRHDDPAIWNRTHPDTVSSHHARDVAAGADVLVTNTFGANAMWLERFGRGNDAVALNRTAVALARGAAGPRRFVLGAVGPTAADEALMEQVAALTDAGVDGLLFETQTADRALQSVRLIAPNVQVPMLVSFVSWPDSPSEQAKALEDQGVSVLGANCQKTQSATLALIEALAGATALPLLAKPSAGLPAGPRATPEQLAAIVPAFLALGVRLLGGCCGTSHAHVAAIRAACYDRRDASLRPPPDPLETRSA
jgi:5-methyltetrahydrofolate--homocysteine methyltransferase